MVRTEALQKNDPTGVPAVAANWTVKKPGSITPPSSEDYTTWTIEQLRKECTSRNLRLNRKTTAEERVKHLKAFDELHRSLIIAMLDSSAGAGGQASYPSKNCCVRLVTILFSDKFATRFAETRNKPTRRQLDAGDTHANSTSKIRAHCS